MDVRLLPKNFKAASGNQMAYLKKASINDVCIKYATYERHKTRQDMIHIIQPIRLLLDHLTDLGNVRRIKNPNSDWYIYQPINTSNNLNFSLTKNDDMKVKVIHASTDTQSEKVSKNNPFENDMKFSTLDYDLSGIDLICAIAAKFRSLAFSARSRGIKFDLSLDDIQDIILTKHCYYTNVEFDDKDNIKTVDRINNKKGYVKGNVVVCTKKINEFKNEILENKNTRMFDNITDLKRFVDILYATLSESSNPLLDLVIKR